MQSLNRNTSSSSGRNKELNKYTEKLTGAPVEAESAKNESDSKTL